MLFEQLSCDGFTGLTDGFYGHAWALGRDAKFVSYVDDAFGANAYTVVFRDLDNPAIKVFISRSALGVGDQNGELLLHTGWAIELFLLFCFKLHFYLLHDLVDLANVGFLALKNGLGGFDVDF